MVNREKERETERKRERNEQIGSQRKGGRNYPRGKRDRGRENITINGSNDWITKQHTESTVAKLQFCLTSLKITPFLLMCQPDVEMS